jgi:prevent-host-death family protein
MYMNGTVGIAELRQNLSKHLERVKAGERLIVTDRNRPVAMLTPPPPTGSATDRLVAEGLARPPLSSRPPAPEPHGDTDWTDEFIKMRDEQRHR